MDMGISMQVLGFIACLSLLVLVHELGHFMFARLFKTRVEKFYLFFNPGFSLLRMKKIEGNFSSVFYQPNHRKSGQTTPNLPSGELAGCPLAATAPLQVWWTKQSR